MTPTLETKVVELKRSCEIAKARGLDYGYTIEPDFILKLIAVYERQREALKNVDGFLENESRDELSPYLRQGYNCMRLVASRDEIEKSLAFDPFQKEERK